VNDHPSFEYRLAKLLSDYLTHVKQQNGLPATLNIGIGLEMTARQRPCVFCHIDTLEFPHSKLIEANGILVLHTHADETPVLTEAIWIASLRSVLTNRETLFDWLASLPEAERTGWDIRRLRITRSESELNREDRTRSHTTRFSISAQSAELTPVA
jgi:hypothetical protein